MTRVSCAVGIRNAKLKNHLKPNDHNMPTQHIAILLGATRCVRLASVLPLLFGVKRTITSYCFTLLSKMQMTPLFCVWPIHYDVSCAVWHGPLTSVAICCVGSFFRFTLFNIAHCLVCCNRLAGAFYSKRIPLNCEIFLRQHALSLLISKITIILLWRLNLHKVSNLNWRCCHAYMYIPVFFFKFENWETCLL